MHSKAISTVILIQLMMMSLTTTTSDEAASKKESFSKLLQLLRSKSALPVPATPRQMDFLTDPSLLVTILHSLEVAYWSLPLGFVLMPLINFFRIPNKRRMAKSMDRQGSDEIKEFDKLLNRFNQVLRRLSPNDSSKSNIDSPVAGDVSSSGAINSNQWQSFDQYKQRFMLNLRHGLVR